MQAVKSALLLALGAGVFAGTVRATTAENVFDRFRTALIDYFKTQSYIPVIVNRGYVVGDVLDVDGVNFYARSSRCFPKLKVSKPVPATFADVVEVDSAGASFALRLKQIFGSEAGARLQKSIQLSFSDVTVVSTTRLDLRDALDRKACPDIVAVLDGSITAVERDRVPFFVVSEVASGKRMARLRLQDEAQIQAGAQQIGRLVADAGVAVKAQDDGSVILSNDVVMPIALRPVTIPKVITAQGPTSEFRGGAKTPAVKWGPIECTSRSQCTAAFEPFANLVESFKPSLSEEELRQ